MNTGVRSIDNLPEKHLIKIDSISDERSNGDGFWIYLTERYRDIEFDPQSPSGTIHEQTIHQCIKRLRKSVKV